MGHVADYIGAYSECRCVVTSGEHMLISRLERGRCILEVAFLERRQRR